MARRSYRPEQIIKNLREAEVLLSQGSTVGEAARKIEVTEQTFSLRGYGKVCLDQRRDNALQKHITDVGSPGRTRTYNLVVNSHPLYH